MHAIFKQIGYQVEPEFAFEFGKPGRFSNFRFNRSTFDLVTPSRCIKISSRFLEAENGTRESEFWLDSWPSMPAYRSPPMTRQRALNQGVQVDYDGNLVQIEAMHPPQQPIDSPQHHYPPQQQNLMQIANMDPQLIRQPDQNQNPIVHDLENPDPIDFGNFGGDELCIQL